MKNGKSNFIGFSYSTYLWLNFEAFSWVISLSINFIFLKSELGFVSFWARFDLVLFARITENDKQGRI